MSNEVLFYESSLRIPKSERKANLFYYDVRENGEDEDLTIEKHVIVNHFSTIVTNTRIEEITDKDFDYIEREKWFEKYNPRIISEEEILKELP